MSFAESMHSADSNLIEWPTGHTGFRSERISPIIAAMQDRAAVVLLVGEPGAGKSFIAEHAASVIEQRLSQPTQTFFFHYPTDMASEPDEVFGGVFPEIFEDSLGDNLGVMSHTFTAAMLAEQLVEAAQIASGSEEPIFILPVVNRYGPRAAAVLEHLIRQQAVRIIATASRLTGGASHMVRVSRVTQFPVPPLDYEEAAALMSTLLGNARLAEVTLRRWYNETLGNRQALTLLFHANERSGRLQRHHGIAYVARGRDAYSIELVEYIDADCTPEERRVLDQLALAEHMHEAALLRLLDSQALDSLIGRDIVSAGASGHSESALRIARPTLAASLRAHMSPVRRIEILDEFYRALTAGVSDKVFARSSPHLLRAVTFGLELEYVLPYSWLVRAARELETDADPVLMLRISLAIAAQKMSPDAVAAAIRSVSYAKQLRNARAKATAMRRLEEMVASPQALAKVPSILATRMHLTVLDRDFMLGLSLNEVNERLDGLLRELDPQDIRARELVHSLRLRFTLREGSFSQVDTEYAQQSISEDVTIEWLRSPARSFYSLQLQQQGELGKAIDMAHRARSLAMLGSRPLQDTRDLQSLIWFFGHWANGSIEQAREVLEQCVADEHASADRGAWVSGIVDTGWALLALQEARWRDAAGLAHMMLEANEGEDPYGVSPLLEAVQAQALAALGMREPALAALQRSRRKARGISQAVAGFRLSIALQAQRWLRVGDLVQHASELAEWSKGQALGFIELQALYVLALESAKLARDVLSRARELSERIDPLIAEVIVHHIEKIAAGAKPNDVTTPEVRILADLGLWSPLPQSAALSAREREVALLASLGYSSRFVADRFNLSERTVETHLAHIYAKLGVENRAELREWFSADRQLR